jgi:hypothetical protein
VGNAYEPSQEKTPFKNTRKSVKGIFNANFAKFATALNFS